MTPEKIADEASTEKAATWSLSPVGRVVAPLKDRVLEVVRQGIFDFELRPGQRLIERELMEQLGVSRATIREVVAQLRSEGLVTNIPQRGAIVSVVSADEAADIYEMRVSLEVLAVQRFVGRATKEQIAELRATFDELEAIARAGGGNLEQLKAKDAFYGVLLTGAASPPLTQILTILQGRVRRLRGMSLSAPGRLAETIVEIRTIVEAIEAGDTTGAMNASAAHVRNAAVVALGQMTKLNPDPSADEKFITNSKLERVSGN